MVIFIFLVWKYPFCVNLIQKFKRAILRRNLAPTLECLKKPIKCFILKVSIKMPTYCRLLTSFRRSNRMFVDVFIECVAWSYWWTWCVLPIICNSKHFSFFVFSFNVSNKISSTPPWLLKFQFSNPLPPFIPTPTPSIRHSRVD